MGSTCFGHYCAHHQEIATIMLITTLVISFLVCCMLEVRCGSAGVVSGLQPGHYSSLTTPNLQHAANQERNDQCGNQHYSRNLLMMGTVMPETCWAHKKYNKIIVGCYSGTYYFCKKYRFFLLIRLIPSECFHWCGSDTDRQTRTDKRMILLRSSFPAC